MLNRKCRWCGGLFASEVGLRCHEYGFCSADCGYMLIPAVGRVRKRVYGVTRAVLAEFGVAGAAVGVAEHHRSALRRS